MLLSALHVFFSHFTALCKHKKKNLRVCLVVRTHTTRQDRSESKIKVTNKGDIAYLLHLFWETFPQRFVTIHKTTFTFFLVNVGSCSYFAISGKSIFSFGGISTYGGGFFDAPTHFSPIIRSYFYDK